MGITEHIEGDECKFAAWTGRSPVVENKMILKVMGNNCVVKEGDQNLPVDLNDSERLLTRLRNVIRCHCLIIDLMNSYHLTSLKKMW